MKCYCNGIEQSEDLFLMSLFYADARIEDIKNLFDGYSFTGSNGNIYEIEV